MPRLFQKTGVDLSRIAFTFSLGMAVLGLSLAAHSARALTIDNRSSNPVIITVTWDNFKRIGKFRVAAHSMELLPVPELPPHSRKKILGAGMSTPPSFNLEAFFEDPNDPTGAPTFFHNIKPDEIVCLPQILCPEKKKK